jgi:uncharacterized protein
MGSLRATSSGVSGVTATKASPRLPAPASDATAVITGASSGIGAEFARVLAGRGYSLTLVARRGDRLKALASELERANGNRVDCLPADLTSAEERDGLHAGILAGGRRVQILVNSAGFGIYRSFAGSDRMRELEQVRLLVEAVVDLNARYLPPMLQRASGALINVASTAGFQPLPGNGTYSASKAFVLAHSESLAEELRGTGVTSTAVCPGPVPTEFFDTGEPLLVHRIPRIFWCSPNRVVTDTLRAVERGRQTVIPGSRVVRAFYAPTRTTPRRWTMIVARRLMAGELARGES